MEWGLSQYQLAPCYPLQWKNLGRAPPPPPRLSLDAQTAASAAHLSVPWSCGEAALQGEQSPAMLIDNDCLRVLVAHFFVKRFMRVHRPWDWRLSQSV